jgi:transposase InsO family protein
VSELCGRYGVSRAGYYAWKKRAASPHEEQDRWLYTRIVGIHAASDGTYGSPRIQRALAEAGYPVSGKRVARLMRENGLKARAAKLYHPNPGTHSFFGSVPNRARKRRLTQTDQLWVGDITYLDVSGQCRYLAAVMDRLSGRIVGWSLGLNKDTPLTLRALNHAMRNRRPREGLIFHSDRGIEYAAYAFKTRLAALGIRQSMNRRGRPTDNAHMESFFHSMKSDVIHGCKLKSDQEVYRVVRRYIAFHNRTRLHSALGYQSPIDYERAAA